MTSEIAAICRRAMGYLELGLPDEALAELDEVTSGESAVLHLRVDALFRLENWPAAAAICLPMTEREPSDPGWWIQAAYAVRRERSIEEAETILRAGLACHPGHGLMMYNLACYACSRQRQDEAREWMSKAISTDPAQMLKMAARDPDLEAIRPWIMERQTAGEGPSAF